MTDRVGRRPRPRTTTMTWLGTVAAVALVAASCTSGGGTSGTAPASNPSGTTVHVKQDDGKTVYWILPGKRRLSPQVFGTPAHPLRTGQAQMAAATGATKTLLRKLPLLVGIPVAARDTNPAGTSFTTTKDPVPVGDNGKIVHGSFDVTYIDRQPYDLPGNPSHTDDQLKATAAFTDPAGNHYTITVKRLFQPDIPGWQTGGGVLTGAWIHGSTGTDSPLFPNTFAYGAFWGVGDLSVNGKVVDTDKWVHFMTTQTVRDRDYKLATNEELPLPADDTIAGLVHHTHVIMRPIKVAADGSMTFDPIKTAFKLPNGQTQPYLHLMFEQETMPQGPFKDWTLGGSTTPTSGQQGSAAPGTGQQQFTVTAKEFSFAPNTIKVKAGQPVTIQFHNQGKLSHNIGIDELGAQSATIPPGQTVKLTFTPTKTGTFTYYCHVPGHREAGMTGNLTVSP